MEGYPESIISYYSSEFTINPQPRRRSVSTHSVLLQSSSTLNIYSKTIFNRIAIVDKNTRVFFFFLFFFFCYKDLPFFRMTKNCDTALMRNGSFSSTRKFLGITSINNWKIKEM